MPSDRRLALCSSHGAPGSRHKQTLHTDRRGFRKSVATSHCSSSVPSAGFVFVSRVSPPRNTIGDDAPRPIEIGASSLSNSRECLQGNGLEKFQSRHSNERFFASVCSETVHAAIELLREVNESSRVLPLGARRKNFGGPSSRYSGLIVAQRRCTLEFR